MKQPIMVVVLLLALLLPFSLSACDKPPDESTSPTDGTTLPVEYVPDLSGYWHDISASYDSHLDGKLYYHRNDDDALCVTDLTTMEETLICGRENCRHNSSTCNAYTHGIITYQDDYIYWFGFSAIYRSEIDGTGFTKLVEPDRLYKGNPQYTNTLVSDYQITDSALYYVVQTTRIVDLGNFNFENQPVFALIRFDIETGKEMLLGEFSDSRVTLLAARDEQALIVLTKNFTDEEFTDPDFDQIQSNSPCSLQVWDAGCEGFVTLLESTYSEFAPYAIRDGKILYTRYKDSTSGIYDPDTETFAPIKESDTWTVYGGKYVVIYDSSFKNTYLALAGSGEPIENELADLKVSVQTYDDEGFILEMDKLFYPEGQSWGNIVAMTTYYVRYEDLEDGLQIADCLLIDHWGETD